MRIHTSVGLMIRKFFMAISPSLFRENRELQTLKFKVRIQLTVVGY